MKRRSSTGVAGLLAATSLVVGGIVFSPVAQAQSPPSSDTTTTTLAGTAPGTVTSSTIPKGTPAASAEHRAKCERYIAYLSKRTDDKSVLTDPDFKAFAPLVPDLVTCGAIARNSEDLCKRLYVADGSHDLALDARDVTAGFVADGPYKRCREDWSNFHELRENPNGRGFMFNDIALQNCQMLPLSKPYCDKIRAAMRAGDATRCADLGPFQATCRAHISLDKAQCGKPSPRPEQQTDEFRKRCDNEIGSGNVSADCEAAVMTMIATECEKTIDARAGFAKGLKALADSGPARQRAFAKAALGDSGACAPLATAATDVCLAQASKPATPAAAPSAPAPAQTAPGGTTPPAPAGKTPPAPTAH